MHYLCFLCLLLVLLYFLYVSKYRYILEPVRAARKRLLLLLLLALHTKSYEYVVLVHSPKKQQLEGGHQSINFQSPKSKKGYETQKAKKATSNEVVAHCARRSRQSGIILWKA